MNDVEYIKRKENINHKYMIQISNILYDDHQHNLQKAQELIDSLIKQKEQKLEDLETEYRQGGRE